MIIVDSTTKSLQFNLGSAVTANQLSCVTSWADMSGTTFTPGANDTQSNGTTAVTIVAAPALSIQRQIKSVDIFNADTADATVTVLYDNNGTTRTLVSITLQPKETLQFAENAWSVIDGNGKRRNSGSSNSKSANVTITTTGSTFSPSVELASGSSATVAWIADNGMTAMGVNPTLNFGSSGTRHVKMIVTDSNGDNAIDQAVTFNLGFDHTNDAGNYSMGASYDKSSQAVSAVKHINLMTGLIRFAAANISSLAGTLDFTGMSWLQHIECFGSSVQQANVAGCSSLIRVCFETNNQTTLDLNPIAASVYDIRAAAQQGNSLTLNKLALPLVNDYHFCVRDQTITNMPNFSTQLPAVQQIWIWNTGQSGTLAPVSSALTDVRAYSNSYTSADFTNQFITGTTAYLDVHSNSLTSVTLTGSSSLSYIDLSHNSLNQSAVDGVLATVDGWNTNNGTLNLSSNVAPSSTGSSHVSALQGRGWTVTVDSSSTNFAHADTAIATGASTSLAVTLSSAVGSGDLLVAGMHASTTPSVSDTAGNSWTVVTISAGGTYLAYRLSSAAASGGDTITATVGSGNSIIQMVADRFTHPGTVTYGGSAGTNSSGTLGLNYNTTGMGNLGTVPAGALAWGAFLCSNGAADQSYTTGFQSGSSGTAAAIGSQIANSNGTGLSAYVANCTNANATLTWYGTGTGAIGYALSAYFTHS